MRAPCVLIVTPTYTHPANQGNSARINAFARRLQEAGVEVEIFLYALDWGGTESFEDMKRAWSDVHVMEAEALSRQSFATCWGVDDWCPDLLVERIAVLNAERRYDAVIVNYVWLSRVFEGLPDSTLKILDTHDLFGERHKLAERSEVEPNWFFTTREDETRGFDRADIVLAIQSAELEVIKTRTSKTAMLVSHPVDLQPMRRYRDTIKAATFGYIGSSNPWNQLSVQQLDEAFRGRTIDWLVGGRICNIGMQLESLPFILGEVGDLQLFYSAIDCVLNPMVDATGLKIKTIEALAFDMPVIGTRDAFAGLESEHPFQNCANASEIADAAEAFSKDPRIKDDLQRAGRKMFFNYLIDVDAQYDALIEAISGGSAQFEMTLA